VRREKLAFTLIEMLVCLAIIMILTATAMICYAGALDHSDLKYALPELAKKFRSYQELADEKKALVIVECPHGQSIVNVTIKGPRGEKKSREDLKTVGLLKRRLVFKDYRWPDGAKEPRTFTFIPGRGPQGGAVGFGTGLAEGKIMVVGGRVDWEL